jgi:hypothetical protein
MNNEIEKKVSGCCLWRKLAAGGAAVFISFE